MCAIGLNSSPSSTGQYSSGAIARREHTSAARKPSQNSHCGISSLCSRIRSSSASCASKSSGVRGWGSGAGRVMAAIVSHGFGAGTRPRRRALTGSTDFRPTLPYLMKRRLFIAAAGLLALQLTACSLVPAAAAQPSYTVSFAQLQRAMERRFPRRYPVRGVLDVEIDVPQLRLLPDVNRVGARFTIRASGPLLQRPRGGNVDLDFALRYEPS